QRIFIQEDIKEDFIARFARRVETLEVGDPTLYETDVGPLILPRKSIKLRRGSKKPSTVPGSC
ncbi:aldehyde dehydrogenase family protein, partial [Edaphobacter sp. HDX4]|uniref:aldehyde dehydrogenase family protein n=1 Tax=Edaphobacter sp. HDX4 TaxID=2794064 RepID=UPI002FE643AC